MHFCHSSYLMTFRRQSSDEIDVPLFRDHHERWSKQDKVTGSKSMAPSCIISSKAAASTCVALRMFVRVISRLSQWKQECFCIILCLI